jgi:hypothetical protein
VLVAREGVIRPLARVDICALDPLAERGLRQVEILGDLGDAAVADPAEAHGLRLELRGERAAWPPLRCLASLVHGDLLASILAKLGVHGIGAGSDCPLTL